MTEYLFSGASILCYCCRVSGILDLFLFKISSLSLGWLLFSFIFFFLISWSIIPESRGKWNQICQRHLIPAFAPSPTAIVRSRVLAAWTPPPVYLLIFMATDVANGWCRFMTFLDLDFLSTVCVLNNNYKQ